MMLLGGEWASVCTTGVRTAYVRLERDKDEPLAPPANPINGKCGSKVGMPISIGVLNWLLLGIVNVSASWSAGARVKVVEM